MSDVVAPEDIPERVPPWVSKETLSYLAHTEGGESLRALARKAGVHASTILRQVRSVEARREDVLVDRFLQRLGERVQHCSQNVDDQTQDPARVDDAENLSDEQLKREACRVLGHLSAPAALLAVVADMEKAVIVRETEGGDTTRRAVLDRAVAEALAFNGWIACEDAGKILKYRITSSGRTALGKMMAEAEMQALGMGEHQAAFSFDARASQNGFAQRGARLPASETPLALLARRRDREGRLFLSSDLVNVGERMHEDFVLTGLNSRRDETWDQFICRAQSETPDAPQAARAQNRMVSALRDLGPGLGDAVLRCCCCLEGLELTEKRMGWSARSGKIVLRIALQRLKRHYAALGEDGALVG